MNSLDQLARGYTVNSVRARFLGMGVRVHTTPGIRVISLSERRRVRERRRACDYLAVSLSLSLSQKKKPTCESNMAQQINHVALAHHTLVWVLSNSVPDKN